MRNPMDLAPEHIDELIGRQLAGKLSAEENAQMEAWLDASPSNREYYSQIRKLLETIDAIKPDITVDTGAAWKKVSGKMVNSPAKRIHLFNKRYMLRAAASLLLASLVFILYRALTERADETLHLSAYSAPQQKTLPDGSRVTLKINSEMEYVETDKGRRVKLKGEAYFLITHNEKQPFIIDLGGIFIEDIGTAFNVNAQPESHLIEVSVEEGEVRFYDAKGRSLSLAKGEAANYNKNTGNFSRITRLIPSSASRSFNFIDTRLSEIVSEINQVHGTHILLASEDLGNCRVSVTFNHEKPETMIEVLVQTLDLDVFHAGDTYTLSGKPCDE
jgi:transmembrane sensor